MAYASKDPVWEEGFTFFVHNIKTQQLLIQVGPKAHFGYVQTVLVNLPLNKALPATQSHINSSHNITASLIPQCLKSAECVLGKGAREEDPSGRPDPASESTAVHF